VKLDLSCRKVDSPSEKFYSGYTVNVCPGGLYFETPAGEFETGSLLQVDLSVPPTAGLLEFGGRISSFGRVLRTDAPGTNPALMTDSYGIALEFSRSPKLRI